MFACVYIHMYEFSCSTEILVLEELSLLMQAQLARYPTTLDVRFFDIVLFFLVSRIGACAEDRFDITESVSVCTDVCIGGREGAKRGYLCLWL
jgi:hypothetical protein